MLDYDPASGALTWRVRPEIGDHRVKIWNKRFVSKPALNHLTAQGYLRGTIGNTFYQSHRVIWKMVYGTDPDFIDHIDGDKSNNRLSNLREVNKSENAKNAKRAANNTSGVTGVYRKGSRWRAAIRSHGKDKHLGTFDTFEDAIFARKQAENDLNFHPNHGR